MGWLASLGCALRFLTLLPVPPAGEGSAADVARSVHMFPVAGLVIGCLATGAGVVAQHLFGSPVHAVVAVATGALVTAGLHLDGLADTFDALLSWRDRNRKLEIMKDSRIGAMGAMALILGLSVKIAALLALGERWWVGAMVSPAFGRWADMYGLARFPVARGDGLAADVQSEIPGGRLPAATMLTVLILVPLLLWAQWYVVIVAVAASGWLVHAFAAAAARSLGGLTGDVYGALSEIGEIAALLAVCAILRWGL